MAEADMNLDRRAVGVHKQGLKVISRFPGEEDFDIGNDQASQVRSPGNTGSEAEYFRKVPDLQNIRVHI